MQLKGVVGLEPQLQGVAELEPQLKGVAELEPQLDLAEDVDVRSVGWPVRVLGRKLESLECRCVILGAQQAEGECAVFTPGLVGEPGRWAVVGSSSCQCTQPVST